MNTTEATARRLHNSSSDDDNAIREELLPAMSTAMSDPTALERELFALLDGPDVAAKEAKSAPASAAALDLLLPSLSPPTTVPMVLPPELSLSQCDSATALRTRHSNLELHALIDTYGSSLTRNNSNGSSSSNSNGGRHTNDVVDDGDDGDASAASSSGSSEVPVLPRPAKRPRVASKRKPTYYVRKEEKEALTQQLRTLQAQANALASQRASATAQATLQTLHGAQAANALLRSAVNTQQLSVAAMQSAVAQQVRSQHCLPFANTIRLGTDWPSRRAALLALKPTYVQDGLAYVAARTALLDPSAPFAETTRFVTQDGDFCSLICDAIPFEGVTSVAQVYDALQFYLLHMEISVSELLGELTIREDDGERVHGTFQNRIVSDVGDGVQLELNCAMFCERFSSGTSTIGGGRECAVIVADTVDDDALFPYAPASRLRQDVTAAMTVTLQPRPKAPYRGPREGANGRSSSTDPQEAGDGNDDDDELMVVVTRTCLLNLRHSTLPIAPHVMQTLRDRIERWGDAMMKQTRAIVYQSEPQRSIGAAGVDARQLTELDVCELLDLSERDSVVDDDDAASLLAL